MKNRNINHSDNWATPPALYKILNNEFSFDFDPCPYTTEDITPEKDGLLKDWGSSNFINPPYSLSLKESFTIKSKEEAEKGKICIMLMPSSTSTKLFHNVILRHAKEVRFIEGRVPFIGINTKGQYVNWHLWDKQAPEGVEHVKNNGMHDSMIVVFDGRRVNVDTAYIRITKSVKLKIA